MRSRPALRDAALVLVARALISAAWLWSGFRAISDDDYARVVIAARFAADPTLDPSGTSWLPLPFWVYGAPMRLFGDGLPTARAVAFVLGELSALLVWWSGRLLGLDRRAALLGGLAATLLPYGAWLSVATVPEAPCAALILFGAACLACDEDRWALWGAVALAGACFCRYEAWAAAACFALLCGARGLRQRRKALGAAAAIALLPIALWLLHGVVRHEDAFFFVKRVTQYRAALGGAEPSFFGALWQAPLALVRFEPELAAVTAVAVGLSLRGPGRLVEPGVQRSLLALGSLLAFLMLADAAGGAATHHPERSLLPLYWFLALFAAGLCVRLVRAGRKALLLAAPAALLASFVLRPNVRQSFTDRAEEERLGSLLRTLGARQVALDTDDFGYFALQAALGHGRGTPLRHHDPREAAAPLPSSAAELDAELSRRSARWLVTPRRRAPLAAGLGHTRATTARFAAIQLFDDERRRP